MLKYSVLMSTYAKDDAAFLKAAVSSMLTQSVAPDEFVLVCDGPLSEDLDKVIEEFSGTPVIKIVRLEKNSGLGIALNEGLKHCTNELVARMDSDDLASPSRCELQLKAFEEDSELTFMGGAVEEFTGAAVNVSDITADRIIGKRTVPLKNQEIASYARKRNPMNHPTVMYKKSAVEAAGGYSEEFHLFEDYHLWVRMLMKGCKAANLPETFVYMRTPEDFYKRRGGAEYAQDMLRFHRWMKLEGFTNTMIYLTGAVPHGIVCRLPVSLRKAVYKVLH